MRRSVSTLALTSLLALLTFFSIAKAADSPGANPQVLRGEILMLTMDLVVVKDAQGSTTLVPLGKGAKVDQAIKVGDHAEVRVTGAGEAEAVTKSSAQPNRQSQPKAD